MCSLLSLTLCLAYHLLLDLHVPPLFLTTASLLCYSSLLGFMSNCPATPSLPVWPLLPFLSLSLPALLLLCLILLWGPIFLAVVLVSIISCCIPLSIFLSSLSLPAANNQWLLATFSLIPTCPAAPPHPTTLSCPLLISPSLTPVRSHCVLWITQAQQAIQLLFQALSRQAPVIDQHCTISASKLFFHSCCQVLLLFHLLLDICNVPFLCLSPHPEFSLSVSVLTSLLGGFFFILFFLFSS